LAIIKHAINLKRFDVLPDVNCRSWMSPSRWVEDNHFDTFTPKNRWQRRHLYLQKSHKNGIFAVFFILLKYPKQRHKACAHILKRHGRSVE
jgi:hypothetical protein